MREVHDESPYPCPEAGCERIHRKGYFRKADLTKHLKRDHNIVDAAVPTVRWYVGLYGHVDM
jgi:hypothetical protein